MFDDRLVKIWYSVSFINLSTRMRLRLGPTRTDQWDTNWFQRNWVLATNSDFQIAISLTPDGVSLLIFQTIIIWSKMIHMRYLRSDIQMQRYRDKKVRVFDKNTIPTLIFMHKKKWICKSKEIILNARNACSYVTKIEYSCI